MATRNALAIYGINVFGDSTTFENDVEFEGNGDGLELFTREASVERGKALTLPENTSGMVFVSTQEDGEILSTNRDGSAVSVTGDVSGVEVGDLAENDGVNIANVGEEAKKVQVFYLFHSDSE